MTKEQEPNIKIDNKDYKISDLSEEAKAQIESLRFSEAEIVRLNAQLAITTTARNAYSKALAELLA